MDLIIVEGPDRTGKSTFINNILSTVTSSSYFHFLGPRDRTLKGKRALDQQKMQFDNILSATSQIYNGDLTEICIWNRSHIGEYVYGNLYRGAEIDDLVEFIYDFETEMLEKVSINNIYLCTFLATVEWMVDREDGDSLSADHEDQEALKEKELDLFERAHKTSLLKNKMMVNIFDHDRLRTPQEIFESVQMEFKKSRIFM